MSKKIVTRRSILQLKAKKAEQYFLKESSYCTIDLPPYIAFQGLLDEVSKWLDGKRLSDCYCQNPKDCDSVNHVIYNNKDGKYAWRPLQIIHPVLYVSLVKQITNPKHWEVILNRFEQFRKDKHIKCLSIPVMSLSKEKDKAEQIKQWWEEIEQESIILSLDFAYVFHTDIVDCYSSIYTHSIAWALHTKKVAKAKRTDQSLTGNIIDQHLQQMSFGQTNGIPQGSTLMDFIAEILLGDVDLKLANILSKKVIKDYCILRYRDDYRIFVNNSQTGDEIIKALTEVLIEVGLKLNATKTKASSCVVRDSVKSDKLSWFMKKQSDKNILKHLLIIHEHACMFPNAGSLLVALGDFHKRIYGLKQIGSLRQIIAVTVDIAYHNPKVYPIATAILSKLISMLSDSKEKRTYISKIIKRFASIPNTGYMEIWLQRIFLSSDFIGNFKEPICNIVERKKSKIWNADWIKMKVLKNAIESNKFIDESKKSKLAQVITPKEIELFVSRNIKY